MYSRFKTLGSYGEKEQKKLESSTVAVVGLGATGSVIAEHLARHGVKLILIDRDYLESKDCYSSNIYTPEQCEKALPKAKAAEEYLSEFTDTRSHVKSLNSDNADILSDADLIMDGTDNLYTRQLINDYSKKNDLTWIYTAAIAEHGCSMVFDTHCFNCVFGDSTTEETCETAGIMREVSSVAASRSSMKAVQYLTGKNVDERMENIPSGEKLEIDDSKCSVCKSEEFPHLEEKRKSARVCGENKYEVITSGKPDMQSIASKVEVTAVNDYLTRFIYEGQNITVFRSGRAIVEARDRGHAEQLCSEILGL
jgi:adenylyltransferase/sulfurtransferase